MAGTERGEVSTSAPDPLHAEELEFAIFCIESVAARLGIPGERVYRALTGRGDLLYTYVIPSYDALHTQGKDYIVDDILRVMCDKGVEA